MSFSTKYRPNDFNEVVGQTSVIRILQRQLDEDAITHSYLFVGASGCGKTTLARIFANKLNGSQAGTIELDAASNNGVDNIRQITKTAQERSVTSKYKVFIIDECHALSNQAWQAFLKCIEEPPKYSIFIFCTTDPQKIPTTIQNRCQRYNITKLSLNEIKNRLVYICNQENIRFTDEVLSYICKLSEGSVRQAITYLEQTYNYGGSLTIENVIKAIGTSFYETYFVLANAIIDRNMSEISKIVNELYDNGNDLRLFIDQFFVFCLDMTKYCLFNSLSTTTIPITYEETVKKSTNFEFADKYYMYIVDKLLNLKNELKTETQVRPFVEASLMRIATWS